MLALSFLILFLAETSIAQPSDSLIVVQFSPSKDKNRKIPDDWYATRDDLSMFSFGKENDNTFIRITSKGDCTSIGKQFSCSIEKYPFLSWRWRVHKLPDGATELDRKKNDSGAAIYVVFKGLFKLNPIIKYVWSSSLPIGTITPSPYNKNTQIIVLQSGPQKLDTWVDETVNVNDDFKKIFGKNPPEIEGVGILTDSDNTNSSAEADYEKITLRKNYLSADR